MFSSLRWTFQFCKLMIKKGFEGKKVAIELSERGNGFSDSGSTNPKFAFDYREGGDDTYFSRVNGSYSNVWDIVHMGILFITQG